MSTLSLHRAQKRENSSRSTGPNLLSGSRTRRVLEQKEQGRWSPRRSSRKEHKNSLMASASRRQERRQEQKLGHELQRVRLDSIHLHFFANQRRDAPSFLNVVRASVPIQPPSAARCPTATVDLTPPNAGSPRCISSTAGLPAAHRAKGAR